MASTSGDATAVSKWRQKEKLKTTAVALVLCLNIGVDPPDVIKTSPCARLECWVDPLSMQPAKALETIGAQRLPAASGRHAQILLPCEQRVASRLVAAACSAAAEHLDDLLHADAADASSSSLPAPEVLHAEPCHQRSFASPLGPPGACSLAHQLQHHHQQLPGPAAWPTALVLLPPAGKNLQAQYERWQPRAKYKMHLDPTVEDVKKLTVSCRRTAKVGGGGGGGLLFWHARGGCWRVLWVCLWGMTVTCWRTAQGGRLLQVLLVGLQQARTHSAAMKPLIGKPAPGATCCRYLCTSAPHPTTMCTCLLLQNERVLFHYNGHGVPRPTANGELWVFNSRYTQYIPLSIYELQTWLGTPCIYVLDCSAAALIINSFKSFMEQRQQDMRMVGGAPGQGGDCCCCCCRRSHLAQSSPFKLIRPHLAPPACSICSTTLLPPSPLPCYSLHLHTPQPSPSTLSLPCPSPPPRRQAAGACTAPSAQVDLEVAATL
jgi:hypothetical protein